MATITAPSDEHGLKSPGDGLLGGRRKGLTIGLVLVVTLVAFEALAIATILPSVKHDLGYPRLYGWAFSAFLLASLVGIGWSGEECDRDGVVRPLAVGLLLFAAGLVMSGIAPSMWVLVAGRGVQGLGAGMIPAVAYVVIGRAYDESQRARMFAVLSSAWIVPGLAGPALAGAVAEYASWRLVFVGLLPMLAVAAALTLPALRSLSARPRHTVASRVFPTLVLAAGAALALGGVSSGNVVVALVLTPVGLGVAAGALRRLLPAGTLRSGRGLPAAIGGNGLLNLAFFGAEAFVPLMLTDVRHQTAFAAGVTLTAATLSWTSGAWVVDRMARRVDRATIVRAGLLLVGAGIAAMASVLWAATPIAVAPIAWGAAGLGMGLAYPSLSLSLLAEAEEAVRGVATSSFKLVEVLAPALAVGAAGSLVAAGIAGDWEVRSLAVVFAVMAAVAVGGIAGAGRLARPHVA